MSDQAKRKLLWMSNHPAATTGYGTQTALFTRRLRDAGYDVAILAFYGLEGHISSWDGMTVYPTDHTRLGKHLLRKYVEDHGQGEPVQVVTLCDVWTWIDQRFGGIADFKGLDIAAWCPVDHDPVPPKVLAALEAFDVTPIAMTRFGQQRLADAGMGDVAYVPHGIDTATLRPRPDEAAALRAAMGLPDDAFVVGMVANNQGSGPPRKAFPQVFQAFAAFRREHPNAYLYMHSEVMGIFDGLNLLALAQISGIPEEAFCAVDQARYLTGTVTQNHMASIYSMIDVLANPSYGEGFGVPIVEAQACGTPVITTAWTSMPELTGAGWMVQGDRWYDSPHGSYFMCPSVMEILEAFEAAYEARGDTSLAAAAVEFAAGYDADLVTGRDWLPTLDGLFAGRDAVNAQPPVAFKPNRAQRRAVAKAGKS